MQEYLGKSIVTYYPYSDSILSIRMTKESDMGRSKKDKYRDMDVDLNDTFAQIVPKHEKVVIRPLEAKNESQKRYINAIRNFKLIFGVGPAGCGKSYVAGCIAAEKLQAKSIEKVIITRPAVEAGERFGFVPGDLSEKFEPYLTPLRAIFEQRLGKSFFEYLLKTDVIQVVPLAFMRGMTFSDAFVILDEAQNVTPTQMKMFLTRIGDNCTVIVDGDEDQKDIPGPSGLTDAVSRVSYIPSVKVVRFDESDIVRSGLVREIMCAYRNPI